MINKFLPWRLPSWANSRIAGNTGVMTVGIGVQIVLQGIAFILVTRLMGVRAYGAFISVTALATIIAAFAGWGGDQLLIRTVATARDEFAAALGTGLLYFLATAPVLALIAVLAIPYLVTASVPWLAVLLVVLADVVFARMNTFAVNCFQAFERGRDMARLGIVLYLARALAAVIWGFAVARHDPMSWAWFYLASSVVAGGFGMIEVLRRLGRPVWRIEWGEWRDGGFFALQMGSFLSFRDIDKPVTAALSSLSQAGLYAAAFRIADVAAVPVRALMFSTYVRFFQHGAAGTRGSFAFAKSLLPAGLAIGAIAGVGLAIASSIATQILGANYAGIATVLLILTPMPLFYALYYIGADTLVSGGHLGQRTLIQALLPIFDVGLCLALVPRYGAAGAAIATCGTHAVLVIATWASAIHFARLEAATEAS
ncbi:MAG: lipopolysaccharide biosynthesis protein [Stellaceae bacterium]